jgi:hypothetical protein
MSVVVAPTAKSASPQQNHRVEFGAERRPRSARHDSCRISISVSIPDTRRFLPSPAVEKELLQVLEGRLPELRIARHDMTISFYAESNVPSSACMEACTLAPKLTDVLGQVDSSAYNIRVSASEASYPVHEGVAEGAEQRPTVPALVGLGEIADILGVTKQRVHQLATSPGFPEPVARLRATPVWARVDIDSYGSKRAATGGPRRGLAAC